jgi:hypothetical protein
MIRATKLFAAAAAITIACLLAILLTSGCASIAPGADPFVVRVEQTQATANATFDMVLHIDQADRGFWKTNAPGFHNFCEWLRTPIVYCGAPTHECIPRARCVVMQLDVDDLKAAYKATKTPTSSNALWSAWSVLSTAIAQSTSWSNIVTTPTHP